jgi:hypothetical protein
MEFTTSNSTPFGGIWRTEMWDLLAELFGFPRTGGL